MIEQKLEIPLDGAQGEALLIRPDAGDYPGVIFYTDVWGVRPANIGQARRLAEKGFAVLMPNAFWRWSRNRPDGFEVADPDEKQKRLRELFAALTPDDQEKDGGAYVDFLLRQPGVRKGKIGVVGHCYTGQMALRTAAARPERIAAAASFHGGFLVADKPDSPHKILPRIKARLYFGHAVEDGSATPEQVATLEQALRGWHGAFQSEVYQGARHGWTVPGRDVYNELQAERAFEKEVELFETALED